MGAILSFRRGSHRVVIDVARQAKPGQARNDDLHVVLRLKAMSEEAAYLASALADPRLNGKMPASALGAPRPKSPEEVLKLLVAIRRARFRQFETDLFANPGWDMLLDLMSARLTGRQVPVSSACVAAGVPATTALRLVNTLVEAGLVSRRPDPNDGRRVLVDLTEAGRQRMDLFLRSVGRLVA